MNTDLFLEFLQYESKNDNECFTDKSVCPPLPVLKDNFVLM